MCLMQGECTTSQRSVRGRHGHPQRRSSPLLDILSGLHLPPSHSSSSCPFGLYRADKTNQWLRIRISEHRSGHTQQMTSLQLPGASTSVGPHRHRVILCNRQSPPTIKNSPALDSWDVALLYWILGTWSCFRQPPAMNKVPLWNSILSFLPACCLSYHLCLSSLITCRYQYTLWSTLFEQEQPPPRLPSLNSLFECGCWRNHDSPVTFYPHVYAHDHFKWRALLWCILTHLSVVLFYFHSMQIQHCKNQKEQHEPSSNVHLQQAG